MIRRNEPLPVAIKACVVSAFVTAILVISAGLALVPWALWNTVAVVFAHAPRLSYLPTWAFSALAVLVLLSQPDDPPEMKE